MLNVLVSVVEESKQLMPPRKLVLAREQESTGELHDDPLINQFVYRNYIIKKKEFRHKKQIKGVRKEQVRIYIYDRRWKKTDELSDNRWSIRYPTIG